MAETERQEATGAVAAVSEGEGVLTVEEARMRVQLRRSVLNRSDGSTRSSSR